MSDFTRLLELAGVKWPTIVSATKSSGEIDRKKADKMVDPRGWFPATKKAVHENFVDLSPQEFLEFLYR
jgi:hypothetical protein